MKIPGEFGRMHAPLPEELREGTPCWPEMVAVLGYGGIWNYQRISSSFTLKPSDNPEPIAVGFDKVRFGTTMRVSVGRTQITRAARDTSEIEDEWLRKAVEALIRALAGHVKPSPGRGYPMG